MVKSNRKSAVDRKASIWLDQQRLYLGLARADGRFLVDSLTWNPGKQNLQSVEASRRLSEALLKLNKQYSLQRYEVRLCLDDALCVTRVVTGDSDAVDKELEAIQQRSQLYISLGLGEKLTGNLREVTDGHLQYALTSIVNLRTIQSIYNGFHAARLKVESIEPVTLSVTRGVGLIGTDKEGPVLLISVDENRCDLAIARSGRVMLSYRISGVTKPQEIADQIGSHMTRLRRFCQRVRSQEGAKLEQVLILGNPEMTGPITQAMHGLKDNIQVSDLKLPEALANLASSGAPKEAILALWASRQWDYDRKDILPAPDLLPQLERLQIRPIRDRIIKHFFPSAIAVCLIMIVGGLYVNDYRQLAAIQDQVETATAFAMAAEEQVTAWESKDRMLEAYRKLKFQSRETRIDELVAAIAPCLPENARLENFTFNDDKSVSLKGIMLESDETYKMLSSIKRIPGVKQVSLEAVNTVGESKTKQFQFEVRCFMGSASNHTNIVANSSVGAPVGIPVSARSQSN